MFKKLSLEFIISFFATIFSGFFFAFYQEAGLLSAVVIVAISAVIGWMIRHPVELFFSRFKVSSKVKSSFGRSREIRTLVNRIKRNQPSAIVGAFANERTELLNELMVRTYYEKQENFTFFKFDLATLGNEGTPEQFWRSVLGPIRSLVEPKYYKACQRSHFDTIKLDDLFDDMREKKLRLILMLDRFHKIIDCPHLSGENFLGYLRGVAQNIYSPICLVITTRKSLQRLDEEIVRKLGITTSPFLNFMAANEVSLGSLEEEDMNLLIKSFHFRQEDNAIVKDSVGKHPYPLKLLADSLQQAYEQKRADPISTAKTRFVEIMEPLLSDMLKKWSQKTCQTFVLIAQQQDEKLAQFKDELGDELEELSKQGMIYEEESGQYRVISPIFSELLKDKKIQNLCRSEENH